MLAGALYLLSAYLLGTLCTGWVLVRVFAQADLRLLGSGTVGARNAGRILGPLGFSGTLFGDLFKGGLVVVAGYLIAGEGLMPIALVPMGAALCIAGHMWPFWLSFHGGKGLATFLGALFWLDLGLMGGFFVAWATFALITRHASLGCLLGVLFVPVLALAALAFGNPVAELLSSWGLPQAQPSGAQVIGLLGSSLLVAGAHAPNIREYVQQIASRQIASRQTMSVQQ